MTSELELLNRIRLNMFGKIQRTDDLMSSHTPYVNRDKLEAYQFGVNDCLKVVDECIEKIINETTPQRRK